MTINRDEAAEKGFEMVFNSYNYSKRRIDSLNNGNIMHYFISSYFGGLPIEREVVERHPEEYIKYVNWKNSYGSKNLSDTKNEVQGIMNSNLKNKDGILEKISTSIEKSILEVKPDVKPIERISIRETLNNAGFYD